MKIKAVCKYKCGENAYLLHIDMPGRIGNHIVKVLAVPTYACSECKAFEGSAELGMDEIWFEKTETIMGQPNED